MITGKRTPLESGCLKYFILKYHLRSFKWAIFLLSIQISRYSYPVVHHGAGECKMARSTNDLCDLFFDFCGGSNRNPCVSRCWYVSVSCNGGCTPKLKAFLS